MATQSSLNGELFGATNLVSLRMPLWPLWLNNLSPLMCLTHSLQSPQFNNVTKSFKEGVELKNHNRRLKCYRECFIACKGVDYLFELLKSKEEFSSKIQSREQAISLMNIFLRWGIIVKLYPTSNLHRFQDNKDLYSLGRSEEDECKATKNGHTEPVYGAISKSTNDLISNSSVGRSSFRSSLRSSFRASFRTNRSVYSSFGKSTYSQLQNTIKKTTSSILKSTNQNVSKLTSQTLNKLSNGNKSGSNLIKRINSNIISKSNNLISKSNNLVNKLSGSNQLKRSTSAATTKSVASKGAAISRPFTRSFNLNNKENLIVNNNQRKFERNYRGHFSLNGSFNPTRIGLSMSHNDTTSSSVDYAIIRPTSASQSLNNQTFQHPVQLHQSFGNRNPPARTGVSLDPMNRPNEEEFCIACKNIETESNNIIRFLTKLSDGLRKRPLKPVNTPSTSMNSMNSLSSSANSSQIILNKNQVQYIVPGVPPGVLPGPMPGTLSGPMPNLQPPTRPIRHAPNHFNGGCLTNPISSTCYNTLV